MLLRKLLRRGSSVIAVAALAVSHLVGIAAPANAYMTAPTSGTGYTSSTILSSGLSGVSIGGSFGQRFAFSNARSGFVEVGAPSGNSKTITLRSYVNGALDTSFNGTGEESFDGQLFNDTTSQWRVNLQFATYANGTRWMVLERNSTASSGLNYLHLGTYTGGYQSTLTMPTGNTEYSTCQGLYNASTYTVLGYTVELIQDSPFTTPSYFFRCSIYLNSAGGSISNVDYLTTLSGGTTLGTAGTHSVGNRLGPLPSVGSPTHTRMGYSVNPAATGSTPMLTLFYQLNSATNQITTPPNPYSANSTYNGRQVFAVTSAGAVTNTGTSAWTGASTGSRTGTILIAPRNSGTIYATTLASDGTNFNGAVLSFASTGASVTSQPITGAITGATGWNTINIVSDSPVSSSVVKLTTYDNSTVSSFEISPSTGIATAAGSFSTGGTDWESFRWFPAATSTGVDFYGRTSSTTITRVSTSSAPVAPSTPAAPTATRANASAVVSWTAPSNGGAPISAYELQYSSDSGATWTSWSTSLTASPETVTGLTNGTAYQFRVSATNSAGTSSFSAASSAVTPATVPGAPTLGVITGGDAQIVANWSAPLSTGGSALTDYTIEYSSDSGSTWTAFPHAASTATSITITGLTNGTNYVVRLKAVNALGTGTASSNSAAVLVAAAPASPAAPTVTRGDGQLSVAWTAPSAGGSPITSYTLQYSSDSGSTWTTWSNSLTTSPETVTGLTNGTNYTFKILATNARGSSAYSSSSAATSPAALPGAPTLGAVTAGANQIAVSWTAPASNGGFAITDYTIEYSSDSGSTWTAFPHTASTATVITITGLTNGTTYIVRVKAVTSIGAGPASANSSAQLVAAAPGQPNAPTLVNGDAQVQVNWVAPASNGCAISAYKIEYSTNGGSIWLQATSTASGTSFTVTGLTNGTAHQFRVSATNCMGFGAVSAASTAVTPNPVPSQPTGLTVVGNGSGSVSLSWTAPASNGGSAISDYRIEYSTDGGATWVVYTDGVSSATTATVTGLTVGQNYSFRVSAVNGVGPSSSSQSTVPLAAATVPSVVVSAPIASVVPGTTTIIWTPPSDGGSALTSAELQYSTNGGTTWVTYSGSVDLSGTISVTGLTGGQAYVFRVRANNFFGPGAWSPVAASVTFQAASAPAAIGSVSVTAGSTVGSINLSWQAPAANGSAITDYTIEYSTDGGTTWTTYTRSPSTATNAVLTGLIPGASYTFRVKAVNGVGSATASTATAPVAATVSTYDVSKLPSNLKVNGSVSISDGKFSVTGDNLSEVTSVLMNGWEALISDRTLTSLTLTIPVQVLGWVDIEFVSKYGKIRYERILFVSGAKANQIERLRLGYVANPAPGAAAGSQRLRVSTSVIALRSIDRLSASTARFEQAKSVTCLGYVGAGMSQREAIARARNACDQIFTRNSKLVVSVGITKTKLHAHVLVLFKY